MYFTKLVDGVQRALNKVFAPEDMGTQDVLAAICKACGEFDPKLYLCATGTAGGAAKSKEFLYDVTCLDYDDEDFLAKAVLVAECEWGSPADVYDDFEKLLLAHASVRVMVFDGRRPLGGYEKVFEILDRYVDRCTHTDAGETWLYAAWTPTKFVYKVRRK